MIQSGRSHSMIEKELFNQADYLQINLASLPALFKTLKEELSLEEESNHSYLNLVSKWVIDGWEYIVLHSDQLFQDTIPETAPTNSMTGLATAWARLTRDLAGSFKDYQKALKPSSGHIIQILWLTSAAFRLDDADFITLNLCSIQALSNLITLSTTSIRHIWPLLVDCDERQSILPRLLCTQNHKLLLSIAVLLLNAVHGDSETIQSLTTSVVGKKVMATLLERLDGLLDDEIELVFEVIVNLVKAIINTEPYSHVPKLYYSQATPSQVLSPAQLSILKVVESSNIPSGASSFLITEIAKLSKCLQNSWQGFVLITEIICKSIENIHTTSSSESQEEYISDDEACKVVEISISTLRGLSEEKSSINQADESAEDKMRPINQILIGSIKLITCLLELKKSHMTFIQDLVRNLNGIAIILNFTKFDVDFPYLREHSIFLIKYLMKDNLENQAIIKDMKSMS